MNDINKRIELFEKAFNLTPEDDNIYWNLLSSYKMNKDYDKIIIITKKRISLESLNNSGLFFQLGIAYTQKKDIKTAIKMYDKSISLNISDSSASYYNLGAIYFNERNFDKAVEMYKKAIHMEPDNINFYNWLGITYLNKQDLNKAIEMFKKSILLIEPDDIDVNDIDSEFITPFKYLGDIYLELDKIEETIEITRKGARLGYIDLQNKLIENGYTW